MTQHKDQMRAEFEADAAQRLMPLGKKHPFMFCWSEDAQMYTNDWMQLRWDGWQAARASAPQGWKLVPIEPTPEMLSASRWSGSGDVSVNEEWARVQVWRRMLAAAPQPASSEIDEAAAQQVAQTPIDLPPAPHKFGDVELWPRHAIEQHVSERTELLEQAVRYANDLFEQAEADWRKDAERYRWLRDVAGSFQIHSWQEPPLEDAGFFPVTGNSDQIDAAIDTARAAQKGKT